MTLLLPLQLKKVFSIWSALEKLKTEKLTGSWDILKIKKSL